MTNNQKRIAELEEENRIINLDMRDHATGFMCLSKMDVVNLESLYRMNCTLIDSLRN